VGQIEASSSLNGVAVLTTCVPTRRPAECFLREHPVASSDPNTVITEHAMKEFHISANTTD
jgi:hypothetical protein